MDVLKLCDNRVMAQLRALTVVVFKCLQYLTAVLVVLTVLCSPSSTAWSRTILDLDSQKQPVALKDWGDFWIDASGKATVTEAAALDSAAWRATQEQSVYRFETGQAVWLRFTVPPAPDTERWYLEVPYPSINRATLFTLDAADKWNEQTAGDLVAVAKWPVPHRHPLLPIMLSAEAPSRYLLRLENGHSFGTQLRFISDSYLSHSEQRVSLILGIFFGLVGLAAVMSVISGVSLRDSAYGYYALACVLMGLTQASATGIAGLHLWPDWPAWNDVSTSVLPTLSLSAKLMFVSAAVSLSERSVWLQRSAVAVALLGVIAAIAEALVPLQFRMAVLMSYVLLPQILALYVLVWTWRRGDRFAPWLMLGFAPMVIAAALTGARNVGWLPVGFLTVNAAQIAAAIELPIVMVVLMLRSQQHRENKRRILGLDRVDPSTGLINAHVFDNRLARMMARSERLNQRSVAMLIDIANTEQTERDFGRKAAEELRLRVAGRLLSTAREIDSAARLSERRFGLLVEGPLSPLDASDLGPRIVARCLMPYTGLPSECVAQVKVAYAQVPYENLNATSLIKRLEERLASAASAQDKRAVFLVAESYSAPRSARV